VFSGTETVQSTDTKRRVEPSFAAHSVIIPSKSMVQSTVRNLGFTNTMVCKSLVSKSAIVDLILFNTDQLEPSQMISPQFWLVIFRFQVLSAGLG